jgi:hypothetical protein
MISHNILSGVSLAHEHLGSAIDWDRLTKSGMTRKSDTFPPHKYPGDYPVDHDVIKGNS